MVVYDYNHLRRGNLMVGFNTVVWVAVALNALGGVAVSMALKFADNILKTFAVGISIVLNAVASALLFDVPVTARVIVGVNMVVLSTLLFNLASPGSPLADRIARVCGKRAGRDPRVAPVRAIASEGTALLKVPERWGETGRDAGETGERRGRDGERRHTAQGPLKGACAARGRSWARDGLRPPETRPSRCVRI